MRYQVNFADCLAATTALNNYEYLDILDRAWSTANIAPRRGGTLCDIGCASFSYAAALHSFFLPRRMVGVEVEGYRLLKDGRARIDYAMGYLDGIEDARFLVADYRDVVLPADVITAWFPFVSPAAILAWRLPLSLLAPEALFARVAHNISPQGLFVMVNHGPGEAEVAARLCVAAGLEPVFRCAEPGVLSGYRGQPPIVSGWRRG